MLNFLEETMVLPTYDEWKSRLPEKAKRIIEFSENDTPIILSQFGFSSYDEFLKFIRQYDTDIREFTGGEELFSMTGFRVYVDSQWYKTRVLGGMLKLKKCNGEIAVVLENRKFPQPVFKQSMSEVFKNTNFNGFINTMGKTMSEGENAD